MTPAAVSHFNSTAFHLAVDGGPLAQSASFQYKSAVETHSPAPEVSRGDGSGVAAASVPLVNNRKGSLLHPAAGSRDPTQAGQQPGALAEASRLQRTRSLPVKYRHHPGHASNATLGHRRRKPPPTAWTCQAAVAACLAFLTNDLACAAVSCATLNIDQAAQNVKGLHVGAGPAPPGAPPRSLSCSSRTRMFHGGESVGRYRFRFLLLYLKNIPRYWAQKENV